MIGLGGISASLRHSASSLAHRRRCRPARRRRSGRIAMPMSAARRGSAGRLRMDRAVDGHAGAVGRDHHDRHPAAPAWPMISRVPPRPRDCSPSTPRSAGRNCRAAATRRPRSHAGARPPAPSERDYRGSLRQRGCGIPPAIPRSRSRFSYSSWAKGSTTSSFSPRSSAACAAIRSAPSARAETIRSGCRPASNKMAGGDLIQRVLDRGEHLVQPARERPAISAIRSARWPVMPDAEAQRWRRCGSTSPLGGR